MAHDTALIMPVSFETFGDLLKYLRKRVRLTQEELALAVGYSRAHLARLEKKQRQPDLATVVALFIPALEIDDNPEWAQRLLELAALARNGTDRITITRTVTHEISESLESEEVTRLTPRRLGNVPIPPLPLIGRERELAAICDRLLDPDVRLLTLIGPPGVGKTRLAVEAAIGLQRLFVDGVCFVSLATLADPTLVSTAILQVVGATDTSVSGEERLLLLEVLRDKHLLLVLDNFEQILSAADLVGDILSNTMHVKVLVTSRSPLHVYGENQFEVVPLRLPELAHLPPPDQLLHFSAIALFVARAQAVRSDFVLSSANALAVAAICVRLDGLPLAIELAAAQSHLVAPQALLRGLIERRLVSHSGPRHAPPRHRTLTEAIAWSYRQLNSDEQKLFAWLGVFVGGFTVHTVEALKIVADVPELLARLVEKSLVQSHFDQQGETRFTLLETIREFAVEQLTARDEFDIAQRQHGEYFTRLAERADPELNGAAQAEWLERLQSEHDNFRAALAWAHEHHQTEIELRLAASLWGFWHLCGFLSEGRGWLQAALAHQHGDSPRLMTARAEALTGLGYLALHQSDYAAARAHFADSLALFEELRTTEGVANSLNNLGLVARHQGDHAQALANFERSLALFRKLGGRQGISWALSNLGLLAMEQGDYQAARSYMTEGLAIVRELSDQVGIARALNNLGLAAYHQADYAFARIYYEESLTLKRALNNKLGIPPTLYNLGSIALHQNDLTLTEVYTTEALALCWELGNREEIAIGLENMGSVVAAHGQHQRAALLLAAAAQLRLAIDAPLAPFDRAEYDRIVAVARTALGKDAFSQAWAEGLAMVLDEAVADALTGVPKVPEIL